MIQWCASFVHQLIVLVNKLAPCVSRDGHFFYVVKNSYWDPATTDHGWYMGTHELRTHERGKEHVRLLTKSKQYFDSHFRERMSSKKDKKRTNDFWLRLSIPE